MKYVFHPEALTEYADAVEYYQKQSTDLAQAFINSIEDAVYQIREYPTRYLTIDEDVRHCMTQKSPYMILYTIEQDYILILAVTHCSREPGYWKSRK